MDAPWLRADACGFVHHGKHFEGGEKLMSIIFAAIGTKLAAFADGAILAASVYLVSRGVKNPLKNIRK